MDGRFIADKRAELGLTVEQMAWCLQVSPRTLRRYEAGGNVPAPVGLIAKLMGSAMIFRVSPETGYWWLSNAAV